MFKYLNGISIMNLIHRSPIHMSNVEYGVEVHLSVTNTCDKK